jgi:transposase-like protein/IS1 family transposase
VDCPLCSGPTRRFGTNRNGSQRYRCDACRKTFTDAATRPADGRRLPRHVLAFAFNLLLEGIAVRAASRLTRVKLGTILDNLVTAGEHCERFLPAVVRRVPVRDVEADEVWSYVYCKERTRQRRGFGEAVGDCYTYTALERHTKMILAYHVGKRCPADTCAFAQKLSDATAGRFQLTTDGFRPYLTAIPDTFGDNIDYATLVKVYGEPEEERRYSPPTIVDVIATPRIGNPDEGMICTSFVERSNLTVRMAVRRFTRLTNAFSKCWRHHEAMLALFFAFYNFCRVHMTLKTTPAVAAGLTDHVWSLEELLGRAEAGAVPESGPTAA